jgi:hypothetical protein
LRPDSGPNLDYVPVGTYGVCLQAWWGGGLLVTIAGMSRFLSTRWRGRGLVCVLVAVMALPLVTQAGPAVADDRPPVSCPNGICSSPPPLLSLDRGAGAAAATPARVLSLRKLEKQAVENVIAMHGMSASDTNAVLA